MSNLATANRNGVLTRNKVTDMGRGVTRFLKDSGYYPHISKVDSTVDGEVTINGKACVNFYSNSFLGLTNHPKIIEAKKAALDKYGNGSGSSRMITTQSILYELEERIAAFKNRESAIVFSAGMLVNWGVIPALANSSLKPLIRELGGEDLFAPVSLFLDKFNHSCIHDGAALSMCNFWAGRAKVHMYEHMDMADLRKELENDKNEYKIIITDGVFSIHGHIAPLNEILLLAQEFNAAIYVDDAHGTGVLGPNGRGTAEELGIDSEIDIPVGTFSKAFGCAGGFVVGDKDFCDYLRVASRTYVYQTAMPPENAGGLIAAIDIAEKEPWRRRQVLANATKVRNEFQRLGFSTLGTKFHIVPILIEDVEVATKIADDLLDQGVITGCVKPPVATQPIIRCNMMATHTEEHLDRLVSIIETSANKDGLI